MAGWTRYNEHTGEIESGMYSHPFMVRGTPRKAGAYDRPEDTTIAAFRTEEEAREFIERKGADYKRGTYGFASLHVENWNK